MEELSFIILRHVRNESQNLLWNECYDCIRKFYKNERIYVIDDNSPYNPTRVGTLFNTDIINSEFPPQRGELLPYYYYYTKEFSRNTIILHDTVYINSKINTEFLDTKTYHSLWRADHKWDPNERILEIVNQMDNSTELITKFKNKTEWDVCFGAMTIVNLDYIKTIFDNTNYFKILISEIKCRHDRMCFERILPILLSTSSTIPETINGDIHRDQMWGTSFSQYKNKRDTIKNMFKVWVGR